MPFPVNRLEVCYQRRSSATCVGESRDTSNTRGTNDDILFACSATIAQDHDVFFVYVTSDIIRAHNVSGKTLFIYILFMRAYTRAHVRVHTIQLVVNIYV